MKGETKRLTGAEILKQQQEREAEENQARAAKEADQARQRAEEAAKKDAAVAHALRSEWYGRVTEASAKSKVRFVVLAQVRGELPRAIADLTQEISNAGFSYELAHVKTESNPPTTVLHGSRKGWWPSNVSVIGQGVDYQYLLVSWGD